MPGAKHLGDLTIRGFRGLDHAEFEKLGLVNVIVGKNDVGKTSVLEAVFLTTGFAVLPLSVAIQNQRVHVVADSRDISLLFHDLDAGNPIEFVASTPHDTRRLTISLDPADVVIDQDVRLSGRIGNGDSTPSGVTAFSSKPDVPHVLRYSAKLEPRHSGEPMVYDGGLSVINGEFKTMDGPTGPQLREQSIAARILPPGPAYDSTVISEVLVRKKQDQLIGCLKAINPRVNGIAVSGDTAYVDIGLDRMIPISMCGSALVRAANVLSSCIVGDVRILLIDEIGHGLHYSAMEPLLTAIATICEQQDMQVFFTTHSLEVLQSLRQSIEGRLSHLRSKIELYSLARNKDGLVRPYRYDYEQFHHAMSHRIEIR